MLIDPILNGLVSDESSDFPNPRTYAIAKKPLSPGSKYALERSVWAYSSLPTSANGPIAVTILMRRTFHGRISACLLVQINMGNKE